MTKPSLGILILCHNEEQHIARCIKSVKSIADCVYVIDSGSTDKSAELCKKLGATFLYHKWEGLSAQVNWGIEQIGNKHDWIFRLDADEYADEKLINILANLAQFPIAIKTLTIRRKVIFMNKWIRFGGYYPIWLLRAWRPGFAVCETRAMDEHMISDSPEIHKIGGHIVDHNLQNLHSWIEKHNSYATREAIDELTSAASTETNSSLSGQAKIKRILKSKVYWKLPRGIRVLMYFFYRYVLKFGFLDGIAGFYWHILQGFFYRFIVDAKMSQALNLSRGDIGEALAYLQTSNYKK